MTNDDLIAAGWTPHKPTVDSTRPCGECVRVDVLCRDSVELGGRVANTLRWHSNSLVPEADIVAWRPSVT